MIQFFNINAGRLNQYMLDDKISTLGPDFRETSISKWIKNSNPKKLSHYLVYGDLINSKARILDIGGGVSFITAEMAKKNPNYFLCDLLAHDSADTQREASSYFGKQLIQIDWSDINLNDFDIVLANDIFPNVDQRLDMFLFRLLKLKGKKTRMTFTCYDNHRSYKTKRLDGDEIFWFAGWTSDQLQATLSKYFKDTTFNISELDYSLYENGRTTFYFEYSN